MKKEFRFRLIIFSLIIILALYLLFNFNIKLTGFAAYNTPDGSCGATPSVDSTFDVDQVCDMIGNGPTLSANGITLNCQNNQLTADTTSIGIRTIANNTIIKNCKVISGNQNYNLSGNNLLIKDSSSSSPTGSDIVLSPNLNATLLNTTFTEDGTLSKLSVGTNSHLMIQYYAIINVTNATGSPVAANVSVYNESIYATSVSGVADASGLYYLNITDRAKDDSAVTNFYYQINVSITGNSSTNYSIDITPTTSYAIITMQVNQPVSASDSTAPNVTLLSPADGVSATTTDYTLSYNVTDNSSIANCSLYISGSYFNVSTSITKNISQTFSKTFSTGSTTWQIRCTDSYNNIGSSATRTVTVTSTSTGGTTGGGGGITTNTSCSNLCTIGTNISSCENSTTLKYKPCGYYNSGGCTQWLSYYKYLNCPSGMECRNNECRKICVNQCSPSDYPKKENSQIISCSLVDNCYELSYENCSNPNCEEVVASPEPEKTSPTFPLFDLPPEIIRITGYVGGTAVVLYTIDWLWLWILSSLIPFSLLRLRHFCVSFIDNSKLILRDEEDIDNLAEKLASQMKVKMYKAEGTNKICKYIFDKSGFLEIERGYFTIINAHFPSKRRAKKFKKSLYKLLVRIFKPADRKEKKKLKLRINFVKETVSVFAALRSLSRAKKLRKISERFAKR